MAHDFISHLEELRHRLLLFLAFFLLASLVCLFFARPLLDFLTAPLAEVHESRLFFQKPYEAFLIHIKVAALAGFLFSLPVFFLELWLFISPGLYEKEKKFLLQLVGSSVALFLLGAAFAYGVIVPWGLKFLLSFQTQTLTPLLNVASYFSFMATMVLATGIFFDFPVVLVGLVKLGVLEIEAVSKARRPIIVFIFIAAAILTPSPDPLSQILLALPLILLFEISIRVARLSLKRNP